MKFIYFLAGLGLLILLIFAPVVLGWIITIIGCVLIVISPFIETPANVALAIGGLFVLLFGLNIIKGG